MSLSDRQMHLGLMYNSPLYERPETNAAPDGGAITTSLDYYADIARALERAKFDFLIVADGLAREDSRFAPPRLEPVTLFTALATLTSHIGLVPTVSTTFTEPFNLARQILSLDHLSHGRAGWNVVTSSFGERNFGDAPIPPHGERYRRGLEHVEVVRKLWDSWEDDWAVRGEGSALEVADGKVHRIDHRGEFYSVEGPLHSSRSEQGHPVLFQAGSSEDGKAFAAQFAEGVYTAQQTFPSAREFYVDLKGRVARAGRDPQRIKILPGVSTVIAGTEQEAQTLSRELLANRITPEAIAATGKQLGGLDLNLLDFDRPVDPGLLPEIVTVEGRQSRYGIFRHFAVEERWTVRQLIELQVGSAGHGRVVGTPEQVAAHLARWFEGGASDGFIIMPGQGPRGGHIFAEEVVPLLQRRGVFRSDYRARTLRGHLGLSVPRSRYGAARPEAIGPATASAL